MNEQLDGHNKHCCQRYTYNIACVGTANYFNNFIILLSII